MDLARPLPLLCTLTLGCGARTGLLEPPPEPDAADAASDTHDATIVDTTDSAPDVRPEVFDAADAIETTTDVPDVVDADAPEVIAPIVELALIVDDRTVPVATSLLLADASTGAILRRGTPLDAGATPWIMPSPDTHRALMGPGLGPPLGAVYRFDVATAAGMKIPGTDDSAAARWSHDGAHICIAGAPKAIVVGADATDGGIAFYLPTSGAPSDCLWSHDDASIAWPVGRQLFVTSASGGAAIEVTGSLPPDTRLQLPSWSPTEQRLLFGLFDLSTDGRAYTTLVGDPPIEIDYAVVGVGGFSADGAFVVYARETTPASIGAVTLRRAPATGPTGAGVDLGPSPPLESPFTFSPDSTWFAYRADGAWPSGEPVIYVGSFTPGSAIVTTVSSYSDPFSWSTRNILAFIDQTIGAGVSIVDTGTGVASHVGAPLAAGEGMEDLAWSPDGSALAYARTTGEGGGGPGSVCIVTMSDRTEHCIPVGMDTVGPVWSTDGTRLAVRADGVVYVMPLATMKPMRVDADPGSVFGYWWVRP